MPTPLRPTPALGTPAPDCVLPDGSRLHERRGQPLILAFAAREWNPAQAYQSAIFARLVQEFDPGASFVEVPADSWHALDSHSDVAAAFGVAGQRALVLLDEHGRLRWQVTVAPGQDIQPGQILAALEALRPAPASAAAESQTAPNGLGRLSRRTFLTATLAATALLLLSGPGAAAEAAEAPLTPAETAFPAPADGLVPLTLRINGQPRQLRVEPRVMLLDALREQLHLTGTKKGCDHGQCGACTVHIDGQSALACLTLAVMNEGRAITTIEGLAKGEELHPMQAAFVRHDAFQCGYCTPGQIMAASALVQDKQTRSAAEIREAMSGNLCRCAAYANILAAIQEVGKGNSEL